MIEQAITFAAKAHQGQTRKGSAIAYILHPMEAGVIAASILDSFGRYDEEVIAAAILHDTVEDTEVDEAALRTAFGQRVTDLVVSQSEDKSKGWKERKQHTVDYLAAVTDQDVKIVHLADKLANLRAMARDHEKIGDRLWERFNEKRKSEQAWYYLSLAESLKTLNETAAYGEFELLLGNVFPE